MKYFIITGEKSGEIHAVNLIKELKKIDKNSVFKGWGGSLMQSENVEIIVDIANLSIMGIIEVLKKIPFLLKAYRNTIQYIIKYNPDAIILVDFPGLNLRFAKNLSKKGFNVFYYVSPTVWAWNKSRIEIIKKYVKKLFVILPFEKEFYKQFGIEVEYEGHPIIDQIENFKESNKSIDFFKNNNIPTSKEIIAILPGSRLHEIKSALPIIKKLTAKYKQYTFVIAGITNIDKNIYYKYTSDNVYIVFNKTYELLSYAKAAIVNSGTATLETALFNVPQVVFYKLNPVSYFIGRLLVKVKYISLVNLILNRKCVAELIQFKFNLKNLEKEFKQILNENIRNNIILGYKELKDKIGEKGVSERIALKIFKEIEYK
ncbi:MAG: lipid-A-disaccharide synthase [Bacteroidales bacterium]|nr:lipid-A-disaccharide synthase [Bacteroidales bacterium]